MRTLFLTLITCLFVLPAHAKYSGGTGEPNDPYQIATAADLIALGETPEDYDKHFILTADIDLDSNLPARKIFDKAVIAPDTTTDPFGQFQGVSFTGVFDGNGHTISHLTIIGEDYLGLFGKLEGGAEVRNLGVVHVNIAGSGDYGGGLVGYRYNSGSVSNCYSAGAVSGDWAVGGLVGSNSGGRISASYSTVTVTGRSGVGGLVGGNGWGTVTQCYSTGGVRGESEVGGLVGSNSGGRISESYSTGTGTGRFEVGGLVGYNGSDGRVIQCYSTGGVSGESSVGGLVGLNHGGRISASYSTGTVSGSSSVGGLMGGGEPATITQSVWDAQTSGLWASAGGIGLTTAEMMDPYMLGLNGFGNDPNWVLDAGRDYPRLAWEGTSGGIIPEPNIDWIDGLGTSEDPYRVGTADQLILLGKASLLCDKHFVLSADIDLDPKLPGGQVFGHAVVQAFRGVFDGNGHTISHLTITGKSQLGLFGRMESGAEVENLGVVDVKITASDNNVGGLVGGNWGHSVTNCYSSGMVSATSNVGGLVGSSRASVTASYSTCVVSGNEHVGGLVGYNDWDAVSNCYSTGAVSGDSDVGGLLGWSGGNVTQCYSTGAVRGRSSVGGLRGGSPQPGGVTACFWDTQTSGQATSAGGTGKTSAEMHDPNTFRAEGWDFVGQADGPHDIWAEPEGGGYPILWWQLSPLPSLPGFSGGTGESNDPYMISRPEELNSIGHNPRLMKSHFKLVDDLDLWDCTSYPIGDYVYPYKGVFDANGKTIRNLNRSLFEGVKGIVKDLRLVNPKCIGSPIENNYGTVISCSVQGGIISGDGGLVGYNSGDVTDCYSTAAVSGNERVGGLVGWNNADVTNCYSTGTVTGTGGEVGGLVGQNAGTVTHCYSTGVVSGRSSVGGLLGINAGSVTDCHSTGKVSGNEDVGGLVGFNWDGTIGQCYSSGPVSGEKNVGGLVGCNRDSSTVIHCYSTGAVSGQSYVGGLVGSGWPGRITACFWDAQSSGQTTSAGGTGRTTAEMQTASTFLDAGWDFMGETANGTLDVWWILEGKTYPRLWWESRVTWPTTWQGSGTPDDPYQIATPEDLMLLGDSPEHYDKHFILTADIDLDPKPPGCWFFYRSVIAADSNDATPAFDGTPFSGVFDGDDHTISHLTMNGGGQLGLFGQLASTAEVKNLGVVDVKITSSGSYVGALVGENYGNVTHCYSTCTVSANAYMGGLVGRNDGKVTRCYSTAAVEGGVSVGGLVGDNWGDVTGSYSSGTVGGMEGVGGLVGENRRTVTDCYNTGAVTGISLVGGLVGINLGTMFQCYSTGLTRGDGFFGGLVGIGSSGTVTGCFWDTQASGQATSDGGTGKTSAEMQTASTFLDAGWDFVGETTNGTQDVWWINEGKDYPRLWWETHDN